MKVCVVTGTRAEYGLLFWTLKELQQDPDVDLQICVTGMHLSPEFGLTYKQIEQDGFQIDKKVEILLSSDTSVGVSKSIGLGVISFSEAFNELKPDLILLLGDRFEAFAAATAAMIGKIPVAHCHGGEATEGLIDEPIRHSITKMSHIHFTSTEEYRKRVIQLGEQPQNVHSVGALGIENINKLALLSRTKFEESIGFRLGDKNVLVTFHPVTLENATAEHQFTELLEALDDLKATKIIFTKPNADTDGRVIINLIDQYTKKNPEKSIAFVSLGQLRYLSALQFMDAVIGNSSSGLIEVPSFKTATIDIGDRQRGRIKADSVISCEPNSNSIKNAIEEAFSDSFQERLLHVKNPYGEKDSSKEIVKVIKNTNLSALLKKKFYDLV
ncbi:UDP-N-acetylglucosamine 2-epimerase [Pontibacter actiniarum]|uniref:UDP-N-acetylglucosamine 2-epimerase (Hydrolyzing) n=1 Tax=Pontibacter actiniarum TaxID=323450 RepID=A0A1X9YTG4_9BACT|nr:UDP-N-acetylglucosamine 2-epimerase [Pontibacter actiniarum]ARS36175.1 UDP-N-acetylglucosamine 2-epimerase (hydrolyzing) [Pontibacter actiniarum]